MITHDPSSWTKAAAAFTDASSAVSSASGTLSSGTGGGPTALDAAIAAAVPKAAEAFERLLSGMGSGLASDATAMTSATKSFAAAENANIDTVNQMGL